MFSVFVYLIRLTVWNISFPTNRTYYPIKQRDFEKRKKR